MVTRVVTDSILQILYFVSSQSILCYVDANMLEDYHAIAHVAVGVHGVLNSWKEEMAIPMV